MTSIEKQWKSFMQQNVDHLIHAKWIITCNSNNDVLKDHTLAIRDGHIIAIYPSKEKDQHPYAAKNNESYLNHAICPGFINAHTHLAMSLFRGLADDLDLMDWLHNHIWPAEKQWVSEEMVYDGALHAMAEMIRSGTIAFNDMYYFLEKTAAAAEKIAMRAHIGMTIIDVPTAWASNTEEYFAKAIAFYERYKNHPHVTATLAPHSTYMVSIDNLIKVKQLSDDFKLKTNIHLQEDPAEIKQVLAKTNKRPVEILDEIGLLSPNLIAIHMTQLTDSDFELLKEKKPNIVHCPESNMKLASGICPVAKLQKDFAINIALGTDGAASNNDLDMLSEMRSAALLGKVASHDPTAVSAQTALRMATINGAKALGIDHVTGSLEIGKSADFIAVDFDCLETQPLYNPVSQLVYAASREQIADAWIFGKQVMKKRELQTIDEKELLYKAEHWRTKIGKA